MANDRDKLIELLFRLFDKTFHRCVIEGVADNLLDNGVRVLPCSLGDTVYIIPKYNGKPYCGVVEDKIQMIGITSRGVHVKARNHHDHNKMYMLGRHAFLTKVEADRELIKLQGGKDSAKV